MEGIDAAHAIRSAYPQTSVVVLSQYADESYAFELFRDGTAGLACAAQQASLSLSNFHLPHIAQGAEPGRPRIWQLSLYCRN